MTKQHVDYAGSPFPSATLDTGATDASSVRPILNGEPATQATLQRPDENLRTRTEKIRTELEQLKYLSQADRALVMSLEPPTPAGTITWNGTVAGGGGGNGQFVLTAGKSLTTRPFLSPRVSTPAKVITRGVKFQTNLTVAGPINPPRAYGDANKYNIQLVNQTGAPVTVTYDPLLFRFTINTDTAVRTKTDVINAFNAAALTALQGITASIDSGFGTDIFASGETFVQGGPLDYLVFAGAADAEIHQIQDTTFASFFADPLNAMEENDVLAIWYDDHVNGLFGGRQQSIIDSPEAPTISVIPVGSLFLARRFPERLHIAIPIATVVNNELLLADGTLARKGLPTSMTGGASELPIPVGPDSPPKFLRMFTSSPHVWETVDDIDLIGGLMSVADTTARDAIAAPQRKEGMLVYSQADDRHFVLEGGVTNSDWKELGDDGRLIGGFRVLSWTASPGDGETQLQTFINTQVPAAKRKNGMRVVVRETVTLTTTERVWNGSTWETYRAELANFGVISGCNVTNPTTNSIAISAGSFYTPRGKKIVVPTAVTITITTANRVVFWDDSANAFATTGVGGLTNDDMPFAFASYDGSYLTKFHDLRSVWPGHGLMHNYISVGSASGLHFSRLDTALRWLSAFDDDNVPGLPRVIRVVDDITLPSLTTVGTVSISVEGAVTGTGTRFKRDLAVGDLVRVNSQNWLVSAIADDTNMTLSPYSGGSIGPLTMDRCDSASSYAPHLDFVNDPSYFNLTLVGVDIRGPEWSDQNRPIVSWGSSVYAGTRPLFNMNSNAIHMSMDNIGFTYNGTRDATKLDNVWMKNPPYGFTMKRVKVSAGTSVAQSLTSLFSIGNNIGGKNEEPSLVVDQCAFIDLNGVGTSWVYINSASAQGKFICRDTEFECTVADDCDFLVANPSDFAHAVDFTFANDDIANVSTLIYDERTLAQSNKVFSGCSFGNKNSSAAMRAMVNNDQGNSIDSGTLPTISAPTDGVVTVSNLVSGITTSDEGALLVIAGQVNPANNGTFVIRRYVSASSVQIYNPNAVAESGAGTWSTVEPLNTGVHLDFDDCVYGDDIDFIGVRRASGRFIAAVTYNIRNAIVADADFSMASPINADADVSYGQFDVRGVMRTRDDPNYIQRLIPQRSLEYLSALSGGFLNTGSGLQQPIVGANLHPECVGSGVTFSAEVSCDTTLATFPNGKVGYALAKFTLDLATDTDVAGAALLADKMYYFFLRYSDAAGDQLIFDKIDALVCSLIPPTSVGALNTTPQGGYAQNDYLYVGMLPVVSVTVETDQKQVWKDVRVIDYPQSPYSRQRRVYLPKSTPNYTTTISKSYLNHSATFDAVPPGLYDSVTAALVSGAAASATAPTVNGIQNITGLDALITTNMVGKILVISSSADDRNEGAFRILSRVTASEVTIMNEYGVVDAGGAIAWSVREDINSVFPTAEKFGVVHQVSISNAAADQNDVRLDGTELRLSLRVETGNAVNDAGTSQEVLVRRRRGTYKATRYHVNQGTTVDGATAIAIAFIEENLMQPADSFSYDFVMPNQGQDQ